MLHDNREDRSLLGRFLKTPYTLREEAVWLWRNMAGVSKKNPCKISSLPQQSILHPIVPAVRLCFVGDIMDMGGRRLIAGAGVRQFICSSDFLFGNFEATITGCRKTYPMAQIHEPSILDSLADLFPPGRTVLSVANNHAGDFSPHIFHQSVSAIVARGFKIIGLHDLPFIDLPFPLRVAAATVWSNRPFAGIARYESLADSVRPAACNIAYPHWGYELELFPRLSTVSDGTSLLRRFDAVIGHHSHTPQPLATEGHGPDVKLVAYSLGDFCSGLRSPKYRYGGDLRS